MITSAHDFSLAHSFTSFPPSTRSLHRVVNRLLHRFFVQNRPFVLPKAQKPTASFRRQEEAEERRKEAGSPRFPSAERERSTLDSVRWHAARGFTGEVQIEGRNVNNHKRERRTWTFFLVGLPPFTSPAVPSVDASGSSRTRFALVLLEGEVQVRKEAAEPRDGPRAQFETEIRWRKFLKNIPGERANE